MSVEEGDSSQSLVHWSSYNRMEESGGFGQPIWTVCLTEIVRCLPSAGSNGKRNKNVTTSLNTFLNNGVKVHADLVK